MDFADNRELFSRFAPVLAGFLTARTSPDEILQKLALYRDGALQVSYAPFDHIAEHASLVIVGITPGRTQALNAIGAAADALASGKPEKEASRIAKLTGSFSGSMRSSLVAMLDHVGVAQALGVPTCATLFDPTKEKVHITSALRYPVFVQGDNYNGSPDALRTPVLLSLIETCLADEAKRLQKAIWLPLGPQPTRSLHHLASKGLLRREQILEGLPHPSGANAERVSYFLGRKEKRALSVKTNAVLLDAARDRLRGQVSNLSF